MNRQEPSNQATADNPSGAEEREVEEEVRKHAHR